MSQKPSQVFRRPNPCGEALLERQVPSARGALCYPAPRSRPCSAFLPSRPPSCLVRRSARVRLPLAPAPSPSPHPRLDPRATPPPFLVKELSPWSRLTPSPGHPRPPRVLRGAFPSNSTWVDHTPHDQRSTRCSDTDRPWRFIICINARPSHAVKLLKLFRKRTSTWPVLPLRWGQRWCLQLDVRQSGACFVL